MRSFQDKLSMVAPTNRDRVACAARGPFRGPYSAGAGTEPSRALDDRCWRRRCGRGHEGVYLNLAATGIAPRRGDRRRARARSSSRGLNPVPHLSGALVLTGPPISMDRMARLAAGRGGLRPGLGHRRPISTVRGGSFNSARALQSRQGHSRKNHGHPLVGGLAAYRRGSVPRIARGRLLDGKNSRENRRLLEGKPRGPIAPLRRQNNYESTPRGRRSPRYSWRLGERPFPPQVHILGPCRPGPPVTNLAALLAAVLRVSAHRLARRCAVGAH